MGESDVLEKTSTFQKALLAMLLIPDPSQGRPPLSGDYSLYDVHRKPQ